MPFPQNRKLRRITNLDSRIFASLYKAGRPLPVKQIATRVNITWPTADKHIRKLTSFNVLTANKTIRKNRISINPIFLSKLRNRRMI